MSEPRRSPRVFTIPPGVPYLATFAQAFLDGTILPGFDARSDPLQLATATIYVPTRRAARALSNEFARLSETPVTLLPNIVPLGQLDAIETGLMFGETGDWDLHDALPEAIGEMQRRLDLAELILAWAQHMQSASFAAGERAPLIAPAPAHAWRLAGDLAGLMDEMTIEGVPWERLDTLAPEEFDRYWKQTLTFLRIATTRWPEHLAEIDCLDRAERQVRLVDAEIARIASQEKGEPVVAIGSTGTNRSTARLLAALAHAPNGAVVLPGLDLDLDARSWRLLPGDPDDHVEASNGHPQMALHRLLRVIGLERDGVIEIGQPDAPLKARRQLLNEALRPADTTDEWRSVAERIAPGAIPLALDGVTLIEASDDREEALALALLMREALEAPGKTASLITPDRGLASRVRAELARWSIEVDDSGGDALLATAEGALAALTLVAACETRPGVALLALLSHALCRLGRDEQDGARLTRLVDLAVLRTPFPDDVSADRVVEFARTAALGRDAHPAARRVSPEDWQAMAALLGDVEVALAPLRALARQAPLSAFARAHLAALQALSAGVATFSPAVETLQELLDELARGASALSIDLEGYRTLFEEIAAEAIVRGPTHSHPRLKILGLLEARLLHTDLVLLGGLDETVWPPQTSAHAFLNRPMRAELGLSSPERRIGQTAHDFVQAMGAHEVVISRAQKRGGSPCVPSRFLQRLAAVAGAVQWSVCRARGQRALALARLLDGEGETGQRTPRPLPVPSLDLRPTSLSVTRIETLRRDPYAIYAERILALTPLDPIGAEAGARISGILLHDALSAFVKAYPRGDLPADAETELLERTRAAFSELMRNAEFRAFTWPRHCFALSQFVAWERGRREDIADVMTELSGRMVLTLNDGSSFALTGIADRIERGSDGSLTVIDYKSGRVPSMREVKAGFSPQLTLEAAMIERGAFPEIPAQRVEAARYVKIGGASGIIDQPIRDKDRSFQEFVDEQFAGLSILLNQFRDPAMTYISRPYPKFTNAYGVYDHLARVKEWSAGEEGEG
jgi:ATP-dependent helicase/nuclease subunit B